jgi:hypothetical protein
MSKLIEIIVSPTGQTQIQTKGFAGAECRQASQFIEQALGQRTSEQLTPEFHQSVSQSQTQPHRI